jgi:signal transduction histidine kinase
MYFRSIARQKDLVVQTQRERVESLKELANALAHEIRNPLTGIKCLALAVKEKEDNPKKLEFLTGILEETGRLESFTYNFLNFAQPFKLNLKGFDLVELIDEVMSFPGLVSGKEISFVKELPQDSVRVFADRDKIRQVFQNIISNAIDAIEDRGEIRVVLKLPWPDTASITISDTGRGISSANLTNIFRPFFTLKDRGSGLGLSIAKKVIELHGGKIKVQSAVGQGTTFTIHLPLAAKKDLKLDAMTQARSELRLESMG